MIRVIIYICSIKKNITNYASNENDIITDIDNSNIKKICC